MKKCKTIKAYLDGKFLCDVVLAALDNTKTVQEMRTLLVKENSGHEITFKVT